MVSATLERNQTSQGSQFEKVTNMQKKLNNKLLINHCMEKLSQGELTNALMMRTKTPNTKTYGMPQKQCSEGNL